MPFFVPPSATAKRKRSYRRQIDMNVCKVCLRDPSPSGNRIVHCDKCNRPYHQYCHDPPIDREFLVRKSQPWVCSACREVQETSYSGLDGLVTAGDLNTEEVCVTAYTLQT